jgi:hypothetical protein
MTIKCSKCNNWSINRAVELAALCNRHWSEWFIDMQDRGFEDKLPAAERESRVRALMHENVREILE